MIDRSARRPSRRRAAALASALGAIAALAAGPAVPAQAPDRAARPDRTGRGSMLAAAAFQTEVPEVPCSVVLVRPERTSMSASVIVAADAEAWLEFGPEGGPLDRRAGPERVRAGEPALLTMDGLRPGTAYGYRLRWRPAGAATGAKGVAPTESGDLGRFVTPRPAGDAFAFTVIADSHLDGGMSTALYGRALKAALASRPDFHVDLGDTFMTDKRRDFREALPQYAAQRYWLSRLAHSVPLFMALGNHDGEAGYGLGRGRRDGAPAELEAIAPWSFAQRTRLFPAPVTGAPGSLCSGRTAIEGGRAANYYAFEWGDVLVVVLDPFWPTTDKPRGGRGGGGGGGGGAAPEADTTLTDASWTMTLGREQYDWLDRTLAASTARHKLVFIHHLVGGRGRAARGGAESAPYFEWGGRNADGSDGFAEHRPGWPRPVHRLLAERGVSAVFHGHDHLYVRNTLDGVTYQCVPQPGNPPPGRKTAEAGAAAARTAAEYGYAGGTILPGPGFLRVGVSADRVRVEYVRAAAGEENGRVVEAYELGTADRRARPRP